MREARAKQSGVGGAEQSLAEAVYLDRLDGVKVEAGREAQMMML